MERVEENIDVSGFLKVSNKTFGVYPSADIIMLGDAEGDKRLKYPETSVGEIRRGGDSREEQQESPYFSAEHIGSG